MNAIGQARTAPTIKSQVSMNRKLLSKYEIKLGIIQIVVLLGAVTGSVVCAFLLGLFAGQHSGYESALASNVANVTKLPIAQDEGDADVSHQLTTEVLAKLEQPTARVKPDVEDVPTLGIIEEVPADGEIVTLGTGDAASTGSAADEVQQPRAEAAAVAKAARESISDSKEGTLAAGALFDARGDESGKGDTLAKVTEPLVVTKQPGKTLGDLAAGTKARAEPQASGKAKLGALALSEEKVAASARDSSQKGELAAVAKAKAGALATTPSVAVEDDADQIKSVLPRGWFAQVAAPRKLKDADILAKKLKGSGFSTVIETANVRGQDYFRVLVGPEENRKQAQLLVDQLKRESYIPGEPFLRLVR